MDRLALAEDEEIEMGGEDVENMDDNLPLRLVGRFLTDRSIRFGVMKDRMVDIWRPGRGVKLEEVEGGVYVF